MVLRNREILLNSERIFDDRRNKARNKMPINVTVEKPDT